MRATKHQEVMTYQQLMERRYEAQVHTEQWQQLRIRHQDELALIRPLPVDITVWIRQKQEVTELGIRQQQELSALLARHQVEMT
jgi:hypothetical protein